jgi:hypothetical protein
MKKAVPFLILILMAVLVVFIRRCKGEQSDSGVRKTKTTSNSVSKRNHGFDRVISYIEYTAHVKCRMKCRQISQQDIEDIMRDGEINYKKSEVNETPCPVYAVQGYTRDREHLRVIFGQCDYKTKVITCYNLDQDFECHCPGDEKKNYR